MRWVGNEELAIMGAEVEGLVLPSVGEHKLGQGVGNDGDERGCEWGEENGGGGRRE